MRLSLRVVLVLAGMAVASTSFAFTNIYKPVIDQRAGVATGNQGCCRWFVQRIHKESAAILDGRLMIKPWAGTDRGRGQVLLCLNLRPDPPQPESVATRDAKARYLALSVLYDGQMGSRWQAVPVVAPFRVRLRLPSPVPAAYDLCLVVMREANARAAVKRLTESKPGDRGIQAVEPFGRVLTYDGANCDPFTYFGRFKGYPDLYSQPVYPPEASQNE